MANNWQPPSAGSAGWAPRGLGLRGFMGGLRKGVSRWGERRDVSAAQRLAIQQYEEEKEEKRLQRVYERAMVAVEEEGRRQAAELDFKRQEILATRREDFLKELEYIRQAGREREKQITPAEQIAELKTEANKILAGIKTTSGLGGWYGDKIWEAWQGGNLGKLRQILESLRRYRGELSTAVTRTTTRVGEEGLPTTTEVETPIADLANLQNAVNQLIGIGGQLGFTQQGMGERLGLEDWQKDEVKGKLFEALTHENKVLGDRMLDILIRRHGQPLITELTKELSMEQR